ncbi:MAG TPA: Na+/H+ antiporter NhaA [Alphaproteobacteria bacterium]|nr:Na+/H+ antiporter NhaA [Alphaproteobacteria bacterium]
MTEIEEVAVEIVETAAPKRVRWFSKAWFEKILNNEATSGLVMIFAMVAAIVCANTAAREPVHRFLQTTMTVGVGETLFSKSIEWWVNDILMVFFFLQVGLELKREMTEGFLSDIRQVFVPCVAALGGICCPAIIYAVVNNGSPEYMHGWAIPTATDIAFAVCVLMLVGKHVPQAAKIFLLAIAIFDDLGAIIIIALFYNQGVYLSLLGYACIATFVLYLLNRMHVKAFLPYLMMGVVLWYCFLNGGIHTTIAGVVVAMAYPMRIEGERESPLNGLMKILKPWVDFFILPVFAFASAGLYFGGVTAQTFTHTLTLGIIFGLFFGKQIGIFFTTWALIKMKIASFPKAVTMLDLYGVAVVAGIGFTMALFVGKLALPGEASQQEIRLGVICGSVISALWGAVVFHYGRRWKNWFMTRVLKRENAPL